MECFVIENKTLSYKNIKVDFVFHSAKDFHILANILVYVYSTKKERVTRPIKNREC